MNLDAIDSAIKRATEKSNLVNLVKKSTEFVEIPINTNSNSKIKDLPLEKNTDLIKKQLEAEYLRKKAEVEEYALGKKDELIELGKQKIIEIAVTKLPSLPKLPIIDPKILQSVTIAKQLKELYKQKQTSGRENLTKGKMAYTYPLKAIIETVQNVPELPFINK
jgi:phage host-nuclease inhibitor protein Gam